MRSARTGRPSREGSVRAGSPKESQSPTPPNLSGSPHRTPVTRWLFASLALLLTITACSSGAAEDARRGQERDAEVTPILPADQATRTAQRFFSPTPTPSPAPPPIPTLGSLSLTLGTDGSGGPQGNYASLPSDAGTAYVSALLYDVSEDQVVTAEWIDAYGARIDAPQVEIGRDADQSWISVPLSLNGSLPPGEYVVYLFANERRLGSVVFSLTPPGSGPQLFADLPPNPQADRGGPGDPPAQNGQDPNGNRNQDGTTANPDSQEPMYDDGAGQDSGGMIVAATTTP